MSPLNQDDDLVLEYLAESREHLGTIENDLLAMEQAGAAIDEQLVNRVFRAAHSIKGGAGFLCFEKIEQLAHRTENVLDLIRSRRMVPDSEVVSILLLAFDKLRELINDHAASNEADIAEFTGALSRLTGERTGVGEKKKSEETVTIFAPGTNRPVVSSVFDLDQAKRAGHNIFLIAFDLLHDIQRVGRTPLDVIRQLGKCGEILSAAIDLESAGTLEDDPPGQLRFDVLYATALEAWSVAQIMGIPGERVHAIANPEAAPAENPPEAFAAPAAYDPAPVADPGTGPAKVAEPSKAAHVGTSDTIRLHVSLLDSLMTLAGELVLGRNQLNEAVGAQDLQAIRAGARRISMVTSEMQEAVSLTRMQPVSTLFSRFPRLVRDLAAELGKEVQLRMEGGDVELDKTILEGLGDPLVHMVRNSVDHGIETPAVRIGAHKQASGVVKLRAMHQAGQVVIEIADDGKGLSGEKIAAAAVTRGVISAEQAQAMTESEKRALIFMPGVSTAEKLSNVSGRGVGMDVVKTNLEKLGGKVEIESTPGIGSTFRIKLPLTLAIIPSLLVSDSGQRFAVPQVSVREMIRIPAGQVAERIDRAGDAEVLLLRDRLVPLVWLNDTLNGVRGERGDSALNIVLVDAGQAEYGLVVGDLHDTVEIVVKPLGRHLQTLREYAGATILGDGQVALILDVAGVAARAGLSTGAVQSMESVQNAAEEQAGEMHSLLLFSNAPEEQCAVPIELVTRVERIRQDQVEHVGGRRTMQYGGASLPLVTLRDVADAGELSDSQQWVVVVFERAGTPIGLLVAEPLDMVETRIQLDAVTLRQRGVAGSAIIGGRTTLMLDIFELADSVRRLSPEAETVTAPPAEAARNATVLVAEDSEFFRGQIRRLIEAVGYKVLAAEDGQSAWELLDRHADEVTVVTTDVEMPRVDGLELTRRIRSDARFSHLPVIALSSLAGEEEMARGLAIGVSEYQVKLDQDQLIDSIRRAVSGEELRQTPVCV